MFPPAASRPDAPLFTSRPRQLDTATAVRGARRYRVFRHALLLRPSESSSVHASTAAPLRTRRHETAPAVKGSASASKSKCSSSAGRLGGAARLVGRAQGG